MSQYPALDTALADLQTRLKTLAERPSPLVDEHRLEDLQRDADVDLRAAVDEVLHARESERQRAGAVAERAAALAPAMAADFERLAALVRR